MIIFVLVITIGIYGWALFLMKKRWYSATIIFGLMPVWLLIVSLISIGLSTTSQNVITQFIEMAYRLGQGDFMIIWSIVIPLSCVAILSLITFLWSKKCKQLNIETNIAS